MLGYEKRDLSNSQSNIPGINKGSSGAGGGSNPGSNNSSSAGLPKKKKEDIKEESDHEKSDGELVVDDNNEVKDVLPAQLKISCQNVPYFDLSYSL